MKLALFFFLSLAVHAAALLIAVSLNGRAAQRAIVVAILPIESGSQPSGSATKSVKAISLNSSAGAKPIPDVGEIPPVVVATLAADKIVAAITGVAAASSGGDIAAPGGGAGGSGSSVGRAGTGLGTAAGSGEGSAAAPASPTLTQARYRETPQPQYPDSARRAGKEGRVLLRVLVDEEGRAKAVEVNSSSGHDMLDQAASEALKKWRFVPAHADGRPIETWVKVPIEFQLSNNNR